MIKLFLVYICLLLQGLESCTAKSSKVNNALLSNSNFLKNYHYSNITHIKSNDFKNHLINTFETCSWDALVVANIPGLSWEYYREHESVFKNIQKLLERSGTIDQFPSVSDLGSLGNSKLMNDVLWTIEKKCKIFEENSIYIAGNTTLEGFEKYIDTNKRIIAIDYGKDFLSVDEDDIENYGDEIEDRLMVIDDELGQIFGAIPSPRTSLLILGSHEISGNTANIFDRIFNKNKQELEGNKLSKFSELKKQEAIKKRGKFDTFRPKFANDEADDSTGMLLTEIKTEIKEFYNGNKKQIEIVGAGVVGLVLIIFFFL
ncbi:hypothetical protein FOG51_03043 [Hanseniaspora uvarum]|uniref:Protein BIG1 n=1 Tax=Hanseniaspora uvarum TaxID=29833 RepID=A0A1E5RTY4_HANUV|nr:hypothetical protein FOG48_01358 [Hanseniaspora uvarum]KAF0271662.1 hypothetical protein FOG51_03043 [Hanseniaspora uvarum]KAF0275246.1 hypothetical protein FOG50_03974 [Hanseniaspora uvarum]OEJ90339.1 hypothetical protein AWRI3580_g1418 [Hanseniaspora uvarum]